MKICVIIARVLLGSIFVFFGLNGFVHFSFLKAPLPKGLAGEFLKALTLSHYFYVVAALQIAGGALCLIGRLVPLGLTLLGPVVVNIVCFHFFLEHNFPVPVLVVTLLWLGLMVVHRSAFAPIFKA